MVSIATRPIGTRGMSNSSFITSMKLGVLINFDQFIGQLFQNFI